MRWTIQILVIVSLLIAMFFLGKSCNDPCPNGITVVTVHKIDTVYIYKDTVKVKVKPVHTGSKPAPNGGVVLKGDSCPCDSVREYVSTYEDSSLSITVRNSLLGVMMDSTSINYKLKVPVTIVIHDSTVVYRSTGETSRASRWYGGVALHGSSKISGAAPMLFLSREKGLYGVGYDPFLKEIHLMGGVRLK